MADVDPFITRLQEAIARHEELAEQLATPEVLGDRNRLRQVAQEHSDLGDLVAAARAHLRMLDELAQARDLVGDPDADAELVELAEAEIVELERGQEAAVEQLHQLLVPKDPLDDRPAVIEIRAGTGGDEAALFAADLFRMYSRFAAESGWKIELIGSSDAAHGSGLKEISFTVRGKDAYGRLRYESGVHRVQRVPATESQGRIHTSAATVAVLPEAEEIDVEIDPSDLKIDVFRSSGPGGQSVNTTDSAVRVTHLPSGLVVSCQDEKSQHKNKAQALKVLRSRLLDQEVAAREAERARERRTQVGTGDRSAKIRTYNFPQNRITDHRIGLTTHRLEAILNGDLDEVVEALRVAGVQERMVAGTEA